MYTQGSVHFLTFPTHARTHIHTLFNLAFDRCDYSKSQITVLFLEPDFYSAASQEVDWVDNGLKWCLAVFLSVWTPQVRIW